MTDIISIAPSSESKQSNHKKQSRLGSYNLLHTLGEGEFGKVKLGVHKETGQEVAIKLIRKEGEGAESRIHKVEREISVLKTLRHPYIVKLISVIETEKYVGIILEYASGGELFEYILAHRYLKEKDAKRFFAQLISSVNYMHQKKVVHRDLKLENLLLDKNRNIVVTDFGFANLFAFAEDDLMATTCGSPCYAAPELVVNAGLYAGSAVDIWSCGVILYAMLCGFLPFDDDPSNPDSDNINQLYRYIMSTDLVFPTHVTVDARDLLKNMLVPDPAKRCPLDYIINHPWMEEYRATITKGVARIEAEYRHTIKKAPNFIGQPKLIAKDIPLTRQTHVPTSNRDRFAPVANEAYLANMSKKPGRASHVPLSNKLFSLDKSEEKDQALSSTEVPSFIPRKPVKKENNNDESNDSIAIENTTSTPVTAAEDIPSLSLGSIRKNQRGVPAADRFLSFFTGKSSSATQSATTTNEGHEDEAIEIKTTTIDKVEEGGEEEKKREDQDEAAAAIIEQENGDNEDMGDEDTANSIASSTVGGSSLIQCPSPLILAEEGQPSPMLLRTHSPLEDISEVPSSQSGLSIDVPHKRSSYNAQLSSNIQESRPDDNSSISSAGNRFSSTKSSILAGNNSGMNSNSIISFRDTNGRRTRRMSSKTESTTSSNAVIFSRSSIEHRSSIQEDNIPKPSTSTRLTKAAVGHAMGDGGRKAMAAVRKSIYRKNKTPTEATKKNEPLISFNRNRFENPPVVAARNRNILSHTPESSSKKSGNKMMDWIKKKSQAKDAKKEAPSSKVRNSLPAPAVEKPTVQPNPTSTETTRISSTERHTIKAKPRRTMVPVLAKSKPTPDQQQPSRSIQRASSGDETALVKESTFDDAQLNIHNGAVDKSALTSQKPTVLIKDIVRILQILGIATKNDSRFVLRCCRRKARSAAASNDDEDSSSLDEDDVLSQSNLEPIYGDVSVDKGEEIRFTIEICRFRNLPGLYIVNMKRVRGNAWTYKFLYHKLIDLLNVGNSGYITQ